LNFDVNYRGVVQLFNAVKQQQKTVDDELEQVGKSERKRDKVMEGMTREKFLTILKGSKNVKTEPKKVTVYLQYIS